MSLLETKSPKAAPDGKTRESAPPPQRPEERPEERRGHGHHPQALSEDELPKDLPKPGTAAVILALVILIALLIGLFVLGWIPHERATAQVNADAAEAASGDPLVSVVLPKSEASSKDIFLPCDVRANQQTAIFSRANGFVKQWFVDVGGQVQRGQLLAIIDTPDVDAQLAETKAALVQAQATVIKDEADVQVALTDYNRYLAAQKDNPGSVTQQDVDAKRDAYADAVGALAVGKANVQQSAAQVQQLTVTQDFEKVTAPFAGTITARNYDVGALVVPTDTTAGKELFDIADTFTLRVYVNVPQSYSTNLKIGQPAYLSVRNYPKREFTGTVARTFGALDPSTRTLPYELDFVNKDGALYAGMYGQARLPISEAQPTLTIPSSALIFNASGVQIATVRDNKIHLQKITVGRDLGTELEVTDGLSADDKVVSNPGARLAEGVTVQANSTALPAN
jgi:membrane fusion protein, multidrug efflux system